MRYTLFSLAFLTAICFTACDDSKEYGDGLEEKTLISEITLANVENGKLTLAASVDYMDSLIQCKIVPEQPTNRKVSWSSSDENVATVTQDGLVHAVSAGKANIVVTPEIGFGASTFFELTVVPEFIPIAILSLRMMIRRICMFPKRGVCAPLCCRQDTLILW